MSCFFSPSERQRDEKCCAVGRESEENFNIADSFETIFNCGMFLYGKTEFVLWKKMKQNTN